MSLKVCINGELLDKADAKVSVYDHGLLYGDGVFEGMRIYGTKVFRLEEHLRRLWASAESICLEIPTSPEQLAKDVDATIAANGLDDGYIRLLVTRGAGTLGLDPNKTSNPQVIVIADEITLYPDEFYAKGLEIVTSKTIRNHPQALDPAIKSLNYLNNILAKIEGLRAGCVETLMLNHLGEVAECTGDNIFVVRDRNVLTPPIEAGILEGITRDAVMELAKSAGHEVTEKSMSLTNIYEADECFLTGSTAEVVPVVKLDDRVIGDGAPGPITKELIVKFRQLTRG